jgi:hypothetical protein
MTYDYLGPKIKKMVDSIHSSSLELLASHRFGLLQVDDWLPMINHRKLYVISTKQAMQFFLLFRRDCFWWQRMWTKASTTTIPPAELRCCSFVSLSCHSGKRPLYPFFVSIITKRKKNNLARRVFISSKFLRRRFVTCLAFHVENRGNFQKI